MKIAKQLLIFLVFGILVSIAHGVDFDPNADTDNDGVLDGVDNCVLLANPDQLDTDLDGQGDVCDPDADDDGVLNEADNCPLVANPGQENNDLDSLGDVCDTDDDNDSVLDGSDNCQFIANPGQEDNDLDSLGDVCDTDDDNDSVLDGSDNCQFIANPGQEDNDLDSLGDVCDSDDDNDGILDTADNCVMISNPGQENSDGDGLGDVCDTDDDNDVVLDGFDNCQYDSNSDQLDADGDGTGDVCDPDADNDGLLNEADNCPLIANPSQDDDDIDGIGNVCDLDADNDGALDGADNCEFTPNPDQKDNDLDGQGDVCDTDDDNDGVLDVSDNCPFLNNPDQLDTDGDGQGDGCDPDADEDGVLDVSDNCPLIVNPTQEDIESDGMGDACDNDNDNDGILNSEDNCPLNANPDQENTDTSFASGDELGDACDSDDDADGILDVSDPCPLIPNRGPASMIMSPEAGSWQKTGFTVEVSDTDPDGDVLACQYMVEAFSGVWRTRLLWTARDCNELLPISGTTDCPYEGVDRCRVTVRSRDPSGLQSTSDARVFSIDLSFPRIREISPVEGSYTTDKRQEIIANLDDKVSPIDSASITMSIDSAPVDFVFGSNLVSHNPPTDLSEGIHNVKVSASDMAGNMLQHEWQFTVDSMTPVATINSPAPEDYNGGRLVVNVSTSKLVKEIIGYRNGVKFYLCRNCDRSIKTLTFGEGETKLDIEAIDFAGNIGRNSVVFSVDTRVPVIHKASPENGAIIHGSEFKIKYTEQNLQSVKIFYMEIGTEIYSIIDMTCASGIQKECTQEVDLAAYNGKRIQFHFEVSDTQETVKTTERTITIDNSVPIVTITSPADGGLFNSRVLLLDVGVSEKVTLEYSIDNGRFSRLCSNCNAFNGRRAFLEGEHTVVIRATDAAGNIGEDIASFAIDSIKPRVILTKPSSGTIIDNTFTVRYSESDLVKVTLHYGTSAPIERVSCSDGNLQECEIDIPDLVSYYGKPLSYYFTLVDRAGNTVNSRALTLRVG